MTESVPLLLVFIASLGFLVLAADWLVKFSVRLSRKLRLSPLIVGATLVALGTSLPELAVTVVSIWQKNNDLPLGNLIGSNIANAGLILGLSLTLHPLRIGTTKTQRSGLFLLFATGAFICLQVLSFELRKALTPILLFLAVAFILFEVSWGRAGSLREDLLSRWPRGEEKLTALDWLSFFLSLALLILSSRFLVSSATLLAFSWGVSQEVIGLSLVAVGTSLPELSVSLAAAARGEDKLLLGDLIGSNVLNLALLGSLATAFADITSAVHSTSLLFLALSTVVVFCLLRFFSGRKVGRGFGLFLVSLYLFYLYFIFVHR